MKNEKIGCFYNGMAAKHTIVSQTWLGQVKGKTNEKFSLSSN